MGDKLKDSNLRRQLSIYAASFQLTPLYGKRRLFWKSAANEDLGISQEIHWVKRVIPAP